MLPASPSGGKVEHPFAWMGRCPPKGAAQNLFRVFSLLLPGRIPDLCYQGVVRPCFPPLPQEARSNIPLPGWAGVLWRTVPKVRSGFFPCSCRGVTRSFVIKGLSDRASRLSLRRQGRTSLCLVGSLDQGACVFFCYSAGLPASPSGSPVAITDVHRNRVQLDESR